ncbi:FAD-dependent oxidoreductase [Paenibacillus sp. 1P07SE]|uniref:FAD-dependent oxidoreductase n=1 Tax=Paenibacillus sp. 1P07SE TaxID=3132209 RepID=UPI0039A68FAB
MVIHESAREVPVYHEADICVLGGSCTGVFAAVRAARMGARVVIVEKQNAFGGVATSGLVNIWHSLYDTEFSKQIIAGMTWETIERLQRLSAVKAEEKSHSVGYVLNTEELKIELDQLIVENQVKAYLHTSFVSPYVKDGELQAVIVENKSGRGAIRASVFIDATGDGDLCARLGLDHRVSSHFQPSTTCAKISGWGASGEMQDDVTGNDQLIGLDLQEARLVHREEFQLPEGFGWGRHVPGTKDVYMYAGTRVYHANSADGEQLTAAEIEGRRQVRAVMDLIRKYGPDNRISLVSLPSYIGTRETRHIDCLYRLSGDEVLLGHPFDDAIAYGSYRVDIHHQDKPGLTFKYLDGVQVYVRPGHPHEIGRWRGELQENPTFYQIPYRSLLPKGPYANVIVAGRMIDVDDEAFGGVRVMVNMNQTGEAAGVAAYLALHRSLSPREVPVGELRKQLHAGGSIIL